MGMEDESATSDAVSRKKEARLLEAAAETKNRSLVY
jgi:hypothetical protein